MRINIFFHVVFWCQDMGYEYNRVTAPVNPTDVSMALGIWSQDVGTLCMSNKINPFAKYKPENIGGPETLAVEQRKNNNFGIEPKTIYSSINEFVSDVSAGIFDGGWKYNGLTDKSWKRLDDFVGYNHTATSPFGNLSAFSTLLSNNTTIHTVIPIDAPDIGDALDDMGLLNLKDFKDSVLDFQNWYIGVMLYNPSRRFIGTTTDTIVQNADWQIDLGWINPAYAGIYRGVPFLSNKAIDVNGQEPTGLMIVGIGQTGVNIEMKPVSSVIFAFAECTYNSNYTKISYSAFFSNKTGASVTFSSASIYVATDTEGTNSVKIVSLGDVSVEPDGKKTFEGTVSVYRSDFAFSLLSWTGSDSDWREMPQPDEPDEPR